MMNYNQLKKEIAEGKEGMLSKYGKTALMRKIKALCDTYYVSYLNNDQDKFLITAAMLDDISGIAADRYPNVDDYINYCMVESLNTILNERMPRKYLLFIPEAMNIDDGFHGGLYEAMERKNAERDIVKLNINYNGGHDE